MAVMRIPYVDTRHAIPYTYVDQPVAKRSAGISKFDQAKVTDFHLRGLRSPAEILFIDRTYCM